MNHNNLSMITLFVLRTISNTRDSYLKNIVSKRSYITIYLSKYITVIYLLFDIIYLKVSL